MAFRKWNSNKLAIENCASGKMPNANVNARGALIVRSINCNSKGPRFIQQLRNILESYGTNYANVLSHDKAFEISELDTTRHQFSILNRKWCLTKRKPLPTKSVAKWYSFTCFATTSYFPETSLRRKKERAFNLDRSLSTSSGFQRIPPIIM